MSQRDEAAEIVAEAMKVNGLSIRFPHLAYEAADALAAAGLLLPPDMTAEKLRLLEQHLLDLDADGKVPIAGYMYRRAVRRDLTAWASFLDTQETP